MKKLKIKILLIICVFQLLNGPLIGLYAQDSPLSRFNHKEYNSFREYIVKNIEFPSEEINNAGILLSGIVLDEKGNIRQVFTFNSLSPSIDKNVLQLLGATNGFWDPKENSGSKEKNEIIIIPLVFSFSSLEYEIDTANFNLPLQDEFIVTLSGQPSFTNDYDNTRRIIRSYRKNLSKEKYIDASKDLITLIKREPLNVDYYSNLITLYSLMEDAENTCYYLKFVKTYFKTYPEIEMPNKMECD